jgi:hypothetical protein
MKPPKPTIIPANFWEPPQPPMPDINIKTQSDMLAAMKAEIQKSLKPFEQTPNTPETLSRVKATVDNVVDSWKAMGVDIKLSPLEQQVTDLKDGILRMRLTYNPLKGDFELRVADKSLVEKETEADERYEQETILINMGIL